MASTEELKQRIDLYDLAAKLGLERPQSRGNYKSPRHPDKSPSLSIFADGTRWKDHSCDDAAGTCIDLVMYVEESPVDEAIRRLHEIYSIPLDRPDAPRRELSFEENVAGRCLAQADQVKAFLVETRKIAETAVERAIRGKSLGFNTFTSTKRKVGEVGYGGPAAAFIVRTLNPGHVKAVDMRYLDPSLNGDVKTQTIGEKFGHIWTADLRALKAARRVFVVESAINALSIDSCSLPGTATVASRGTGNVDNIDWRFLQGKEVIVAMDNDAPNERTGYCPGQKSAWSVYEHLTGLNISAMLLDQSAWDDAGWNDLNDVLQDVGASGLKIELNRLEHWAIPGMIGDAERQKGRSRLFLPSYDFAHYWKYRVKPDFTTYVSKVEKDDEAGDDKLTMQDLCGFRVAGISRVTVASALSTMTGEVDAQPQVLFSVSVQAPRHGANLQRRVFEDEQLHNVDQWRKFGPVFQPSAFNRMVSILERSADLGARHAVNFVGLAWREGKLVVNEGPDCYFTNPQQQCPYHNLTFHSGSKEDARQVINAYQATFKHNAALQLLVWGLGAHLKALLGFWPHMIMQADKGAGKSTLIKRLERTLTFTMFSGQSLETVFRIVTSISSTSHPVGWEEISARRQQTIDAAVNLLQESYQYTINRRNSEMTEYILSAPVLMAGEDVPVRSLLGKVVRASLKPGAKGTQMRESLPRFPMLQWLQFLAKHYDRSQIQEIYGRYRKRCLDLSRASGDDDGAVRMAGNYAAVLMAWRLLCEFAGVEESQGDFPQDVLHEMNEHISETSQDREPWVWIMEIALSEIDRGEFRYPHMFDSVQDDERVDVECLLVRTSNIMDHIAHSPALRDRWNALPVKSDRVFKRQLRQAGVIVAENKERVINSRRVSNLVAVDLDALVRYGLSVGWKETAPV